MAGEIDKLKWIMSRCKNSVTVTVNDHRDYYEPLKEWLSDQKDIPDDVLSKMIETDTCIWVQVYPITPIGFYCVYHYDLDIALDIIIDALKND